MREDASLAALYPISLASGVLLLGLAGRKLDLLHLLFGSALAVDADTLSGMLATAAFSLLVLALIYRALALDSLDPLFLRSVSRIGPLAHAGFLTLVVLNLVIGFQAIGALMVVGLMMLPAAAARFWSRRLPVLLPLAALLGALCVWLGLLLSFYASLSSGPCIVLLAGAFYLYLISSTLLIHPWRSVAAIAAAPAIVRPATSIAAMSLRSGPGLGSESLTIRGSRRLSFRRARRARTLIFLPNVTILITL